MAGIRGGGFWPKQAKDGSWYLEGTLGYGVAVRVYENKYKKSDKDPSHVWYISQKEQTAEKKPYQKSSGFSPRAPEVKEPYSPPPPTKFSGTVPPDENQAPWPDVDGDEPLPF